MVSTHSQYITDFKLDTKAMEAGKSPLAMLAKTCETIGLPDTQSKKGSSEKKEEKRIPANEPSTSSGKTSTSKSSPRATPASKEPTLTFPGLPKPTFQMGMPSMPFPFFNPMMPYPMPFPAFQMGGNPFMGNAGAGRMPCPYAMMRQPCMTPGCSTCIPSSVASACTPEMMAQFAAAAAHPLFSAYAGMLPTVSGASSMPYQSLLAAAAASSSAAAAVPSTSSASTTTPVRVAQSPKTSSATSTPQPPKHSCNWMESTGVCGKKFGNEEELANHVKSVHTPSPPSSASSVSDSNLKTPVSRPSSSAQVRFNPYAKPSSGAISMPTTPLMPPMPLNMSMPMLPFPNALQAMYQQRLMSSMHHP